MVPVEPVDSSHAFIDVTAYNSKVYYVQGDVATPGKMPWTGGDTVLDAINHGAGLIATADPKNIRLFRPARAGKPAKVYPIDLDAIQHGEARLNYQLFPGDRVVVGRDKMIALTIAQDRQAAEFQTLVNSSLQLSSAIRTLVAATPDLTPAQRESLMRDWFDLWWKSTQRPGGPVPDEATYRELMLKLLKNPKDAAKAETPAKK